MIHKSHFFNCWIGLQILLVLLAGCQPFAISAVVEPNQAQGANGRSFDVSVNVDPGVAALVAATLVATPTTAVAANTAPTAVPVTATVTPPTATGTSVPPVATPAYPAIIAQASLNVRSGPGIDYTKIGGLEAGALAQVVGKSAAGDWWQIVYPANSDQRAWITADPRYSQVYHGEQIAIVTLPMTLPTPTPLPTPQQLRLVVNTDLNGANKLMIMNLIGGERQWVYDGNGSDNVYPTVSPDGQRVAFVSDRDGNQEIYVVNVDGSNLTRLTYAPGSDKWPAWSPDGQRLAFDSERDGNRELYIMNADGSGVFRVTNHWAEDGAPSWSPDSKQLVFHSNRDGNHEIYTMNVDGSNLRRLTYHTGHEWTPAWSPDGTQIAFMGYHDSQSADIYLMDTNVATTCAT
ncbi:MAG: SH3 domain-containing protein [Caldilineaceae bacterium]